jgi:hypothetical protein
MTEEPRTKVSRRSGYEQFVDIFDKYRSLSVSAGAAGVAPFVAYLVGIAPPWPPGVVAITTLVELLTLMLVFHFLKRSARRLVDRVLAICAGSLVILGVVYLIAFSFLTYKVPGGSARGVIGFICRKDIPRDTAASCPYVDIDKIKDAGYNARLIWSDWTVDLTTSSITLLWLGCFVVLATVIGTFVVYQSRVRR